MDTSATIDGVTIEDGHTSTGSGAGILNDGTLTLQNSTVSDNSAENDGGAIENQDSLTTQGTTFIGNSGRPGGAIDQEASDSTTLTDDIISDNNAGGDGGGIYADSGTVSITEGTIGGTGASSPADEGNSTDSCGGGLALDGAAGTTSGVTFEGTNTTQGNTASQCGGGVYITDGDPSISGGTISDNTADSEGGGVFIETAPTRSPASASREHCDRRQGWRRLHRRRHEYLQGWQHLGQHGRETTERAAASSSTTATTHSAWHGGPQSGDRQRRRRRLLHQRRDEHLHGRTVNYNHADSGGGGGQGGGLSRRRHEHVHRRRSTPTPPTKAAAPSSTVGLEHSPRPTSAPTWRPSPAEASSSSTRRQQIRPPSRRRPSAKTASSAPSERPASGDGGGILSDGCNPINLTNDTIAGEHRQRFRRRLLRHRRCETRGRRKTTKRSRELRLRHDQRQHVGLRGGGNIITNDDSTLNTGETIIGRRGVRRGRRRRTARSATAARSRRSATTSIDDTTCGTPGTGDIIGSRRHLGTLGDNGGPDQHRAAGVRAARPSAACPAAVCTAPG